MNQSKIEKDKFADRAALVISITFFGFVFLLAALWLWDLVGDILVKIESTLF